MKTRFTHISKTVVDNSAVEFTIQHTGTDQGYDQVTLRAVPTDNGIIFVIGGLGDRLPIQVLSPSNHVELVWTEKEVALQKSRMVETLRHQLEAKHRDYDRLFTWLRTAMDKPNGFQLWVDINKNAGRDPIALILKGETPEAIKNV